MADPQAQIQRLTARVQQLETERTQLNALLEVSLSLASEQDPQRVLETLMAKVIAVTGAERGTIWIVDDHDRTLAAAVMHPVKVTLPRLSWGEGIAGRVTERGEPLLVSDVQSDPNWARRFDSNTGFVTRSILCAPLLAKGEALGCIQLLNKQGDRLFTEVDMELLVAIANQAGLLIQNARLLHRSQTLFSSMVTVLSATIDARDPYTAGHSSRVAHYARLIAAEMGLDPKEVDYLYMAALLHDLGKIGVRDSILLKPGALDDDERQQMNNHTVIGAEIISQMEPRDYLQGVVLAARHHHERVAGGGYPDNLRGEDISLQARIIAVADVFDALVTDRPYKKGWPLDRILKLFAAEKGTHFDPICVDAFFRGLTRQEPERMSAAVAAMAESP